MKKTIIALMALAGVAAAGTTSPTVVAFGNSDTSALKAAHPFITDAFYVHGTSNPSITLSNGDVISFSTDGATYAGGTDGSVEKSWGNSAAITEMNAALGLTSGFTAADFSTGSDIYYTATGNSGSKSSITLTLNSANVGDTITLFVTAASRAQHTAGFSITGLAADSITLSYAGLNGNGFTAASGNSVNYSADLAGNWSPNTESVMIYKVTGVLESTSLTMAQGGTVKNGWQTLSYVVVPEPTTATLSLLALAGLAARRRRK